MQMDNDVDAEPALCAALKTMAARHGQDNEAVLQVQDELVRLLVRGPSYF